MRNALLLLAIACVAPACKKLKTGALEEFATRYSCPEDRVKVSERTDIQPADLKMKKSSKASPPKEVADDPARLAKWKKDHADKDDTSRSYYNSSYDVFEVEGCGHHVLMTCHHPSGSKGGTRMDQVSCDEHALSE